MDVPGGPRVAALYRYPVKGLSAEPLDEVELRADEGVPGDRVFALALPDTEFDEERPTALRKQRFLMLQRDEALARVRTGYDPGTGLLSVDDGSRRWSADLGTAAGRRAVEEYFGALAAATAGTDGANPPAGLAGPEGRSGRPGRRSERPAGRSGLPRLVTARGGHRFTDAGPSGPALMQAVSVVNLSSVRDLAERVGQPVHPLRFRANVYLDGIPAWAEREWVGKEIVLGPVRARVLAGTVRCAATTVNPDTAERDIKVLKELSANYGHTECGCYIQIGTPGVLRLGDAVAPPAAA
ncbi:MOSC domain-containing protein [Frankia sp. CNm7]|uniref:MOSC domain-containing protein n=1 Tax=Frankia nepalensis TaxID=1836974 RepID=A0A937REZ0_9ACTN|nr:MOSC domain-containing protein [Frankia nepalensis]MBL7495366.1 MOSC domain-containing protein [Frankia nepalensis]MBL7514476.1 MOSC domain-containing protein [Frankia nepalensis]MBL7521544.1 MOSC domain-containing protein [Frankia nepalensis]MBL7627745.1 MOSC domain-containing protein [Frankia nepalensis]